MNRRVAVVPALLAFLVLLAPLALAQGPPAPAPTVNPRPRSLTLRGNLRFSHDERPAEMVKIELRRFSGDLVGATFTRFNGEFEFAGLAGGSYLLIVEEEGYEPVRETVEVNSSARFGVVVYLKKLFTGTPGQSGNAVTVRELSLPQGTRSTYRKGLDTLYVKSNAAASVTLFQQVIKNSPNFYEAFFHMGIAYDQLRKQAEAEEAFRRSVAASDAKYPEAFIALGSLLITLERPAEGEASVRRGLALNASLWQGHYEMGRALMAQNRLEEAEQSLKELLKLRNDYAPAYLLLANIHIRQKNQVALLGDLNEFLRLEPNGPQSAQARVTRDRLQQASDNARNATPPKP